MAKKRTRARKQARQSITSRVEAYIKKHPKAKARDVATALRLDITQVHPAIGTLRKSGKLPAGACPKRGSKGVTRWAGKTIPWDNPKALADDIIVVKRIGLDRVRAVITLLEQIEKE